jgi:hypothetical protein
MSLDKGSDSRFFLNSLNYFYIFCILSLSLSIILFYEVARDRKSCLERDRGAEVLRTPNYPPEFREQVHRM